MRNPKTIAVITAALLLIVVILQNTESVETRVLFFTVAMPRVLLLVVTLLIGFTLGLLISPKLRPRKDVPKI